MRSISLAAVAAATLLAGCQSSDPGVRGAGRGAAIGAGVGGLVGAVSGDVGVVEGAAAGAALGAVVGAATADGRRYYWDGRDRCYYVSDGRRVYVDRDRCD